MSAWGPFLLTSSWFSTAVALLTLAVFQAEVLAHFRIHSHSLFLLREFQTALDPVAVLDGETRLALEAAVLRHDSEH